MNLTNKQKEIIRSRAETTMRFLNRGGVQAVEPDDIYYLLGQFEGLAYDVLREEKERCDTQK